MSTLWRLFDLSGVLLVSQFHQECLAGKQGGAALRSAPPRLRDEIPCGRHLRCELRPQWLDDVDDRAVRKGCQNQSAYDGLAFPDSRPFAAEVHGAAFIAGGLVGPLAAVSGRRREPAG